MKLPPITTGSWKHHLGRGKTPRFHIQTNAGYQIASTVELKTPRTVTRVAEFEENTQIEANARAFAALPDVLAKANRVLNEGDITGCDEGFIEISRETLDELRAALLKAGCTE